MTMAVSVYGQKKPSAIDPLQIVAPRLENTEIKIDGYLDESVWNSAASQSGFITYLPVDGRRAEDDTEILIWYSPTALYVGIIAQEIHGEVRSTLADRDKLDNDPDNLQVLTKEEHQDVHKNDYKKRVDRVNKKLKSLKTKTAKQKIRSPKINLQDRLSRIINAEKVRVSHLFSEFRSSGGSSGSCGRCGGTGYLPQFSHVAGGVCFLCGGSCSVDESNFENFEPQEVPKGYKHSYFTYSVKSPFRKLEDWKSFYKFHVNKGGDSFYAMMSTVYEEDVMRKNENYKDWRRACPVTEEIQPRCMLFKTNYRSIAEAEKHISVFIFPLLPCSWCPLY